MSGKPAFLDTPLRDLGFICLDPSTGEDLSVGSITVFSQNERGEEVFEECILFPVSELEKIIPRRK